MSVARSISALDRRGQLFPASELLVDAIERRQRRRLLRILLEDRLIELRSPCPAA